jgi:hypothetical protein
MVTEENNKSNDTKPEEAASQSVVPVNVEVQQFDLRMRNVEKVVEMVKDISEKASRLLTKHLEGKTECEKRQQEIDHIQHKRDVYLLVFAVSVIFILCMTALLQKEVELVKFFITSSLAIAAGTGIASLLRVGSKRKKKPDEE